MKPSISGKNRLFFGFLMLLGLHIAAGAATQSVVNLALYTGPTNLPITGFNPIANGATIDLAKLPTRQLNIAANTSPGTVGSVKFGLDANANYHTESVIPYMLQGDGSSYVPWTPSLGSHTVTATPYTGAGATGTAGTPLTISFKVIDSGTSVTSIAPTGARIICGGAAYTDAQKQVWDADRNFVGGDVYSTAQPIAGTADGALYQSERYGQFSYSIPLQNGTYDVDLHFAEIYFTAAGQRVFSVNVEGQLAIDHLDIFASVGSNAALTRTVRATVADGILNLDFLSNIDNAKISSIEVRPAGGAKVVSLALYTGPTNLPISGFNPISNGATIDLAKLPTRQLNVAANTSPSTVGSVRFGLDSNANYVTDSIAPYMLQGDGSSYVPWTPSLGSHTVTATPYTGAGATGTAGTPLTISFTVIDSGSSSTPTAARIICGGAAYTDTQKQVWDADRNFVGGDFYSTTQSIAGTADGPLYQSERFGQFSYSIPLQNGTYDVDLHFAEIYFTTAGDRVFSVNIEGQLAIDHLDIFASAGSNVALTRTVRVTVADGILNLDFVPIIENPKISSIEVRPAGPQIYLHTVLDVPSYAVDYDGTGAENIALIGHDSHTHEAGHALVSWRWTEGSKLLGTTADTSASFTLGSHNVTLTIGDDAVPQKTDSASTSLSIYPINAVGGLLARYFPTSASALSGLIDALPATPGFVEVLPALVVNNVAGSIGNSPYSANSVASLLGIYQVPTAGTYQFTVSGGVQRRLFIDGKLVSGPLSLAAGPHTIEARFAIDSTASLPGQVLYSVNGSVAQLMGPAGLTHDEMLLKPFINNMPASGAPLGGNQINLSGIGFFPASSVKVHWGAALLTPPAINVGQKSIQFTSPAGSGTINVTVETPNGVSNAVPYTYVAGSVPIAFNRKNITALSAPTQGAWGPDGRFYVAGHNGTLDIYTLADEYAVLSAQHVAPLAEASNPNILGIAFNPLDPPTPVKVYLSHGRLFANGGGAFTGTSAYSGQVSVLTGPNFSTVQPLITGLPISNHDHGVNGMQFDNYGDLWISAGGNTNAGVPAVNTGTLPESPLSGAVLKARLSKSGFNGTIKYVDSATGVANADQVFGGKVDVAPGVDVSVFSHGVRNGFDIVWTTRGKLYGTDNGPNYTYGAASTSATTQSADPEEDDKLGYLVEGEYYGAANRNRGRYDSRQNVWRSISSATIPGVYATPLVTLPSSCNGIDEYRAATFNGQMRGNLLVQKWNGQMYIIQLSPDGRSVQKVDTSISGLYGLDLVSGPGGAILSVDYTGNRLDVLQPADASASGVKAFDIFPWRARSDGTASFTIGGIGFGTLSNATVSIGGRAAPLTSVSATRIKGTIPMSPAPTAGLVDVVIQSNGNTSTLSKAFRYVLSAGTGTGIWETGAAMPVQLGEVTAGAINGVIYVIGEGSAATLGYDVKTGVWQSNLASRPLVGNHHACEVINGKLYLFGGLGGGSDGKVQIYSPATNVWTQGASIPFPTGSASTALISGKVYLAGGIVGTATVNQAAVYDPVTNIWTSIAAMPVGCNHAAAGTDGKQFYVFGGRDGDNVPSLGFDSVQIYNPATNVWQLSTPVLPQKRGGMGKAPFFNGEFYVIGGETTSAGTGQIAGNVYNRVDVYSPVTKQWRLEQAVPTARHGIFPIAYDGRIFVIGGGVQAGFSSSNIVEIFSR